MGFGELENLTKSCPSRRRIIGRTNDGDDFVNVEHGNEKAIHEMEVPRCLVQAELGAAPNHVDAVIDKHLKKLLQPQRARLAVHERHVVDAEGIFKGSETVQLSQNSFRVEPVLELHDEPHPVVTVRKVVNAAHAGDFLRSDGILELFDDFLGAHQVGEFGKDDSLLACRHVFDARRGPGLEDPAAGFVGLTNRVKPNDLAALRKVRSRDKAHEIIQGGIGVFQQVLRSGNHFYQIMRGHVGCHSHGDARGAVHQEVGDGGGEDRGLGLRVVVIWHHVHDVFIQRSGHGKGGGPHAYFRVARGGRPVIERTEIAVPIHQW